MREVQTWLVGSNMYGLATENSDRDYASVYFDRVEYLNPLVEREKSHTENDNNVTFHSAAKFARLLIKGNFNITDLVYHEPVSRSEFISGLITEARQYAITQATASAYMGYVNEQFRRGFKPSTPQNANRKAQAERDGYDAKYVMHMLRGIITLNNILVTGEYHYLNDSDRKLLLMVRTGTAYTLEEIVTLVTEEHKTLEANYNKYSDALPTTEKLEQVISEYFIDYYR